MAIIILSVALTVVSIYAIYLRLVLTRFQRELVNILSLHLEDAIIKTFKIKQEDDDDLKFPMPKIH